MLYYNKKKVKKIFLYLITIFLVLTLIITLLMLNQTYTLGLAECARDLPYRYSRRFTRKYF